MTGPFVATPGIACGVPLSGSCTVDVTFLPVAGGLGTGTLTAGSGGSADLRGTGLAPVGSTQASKPSNQFGFGKLKLNKDKGTALLTIDVPSQGNLTLGGNGVVNKRAGGGAAASKAVGAAGKVTLLIKAKGAKKSKLNDTGKVKVKPKITFTPTGGTGLTQTKTVKLKKNL